MQNRRDVINSGGNPIDHSMANDRTSRQNILCRCGRCLGSPIQTAMNYFPQFPSQVIISHGQRIEVMTAIREALIMENKEKGYIHNLKGVD